MPAESGDASLRTQSSPRSRDCQQIWIDLARIVADERDSDDMIS